MIKKEKKQVFSKGKPITPKKLQKNVEFSLDAPEALAVFVAGDFNGWDIEALPMKKGKDAVWKAKVLLPPGRYEYKMYCDGAWIETLPDVDSTPNPFGTRNFVKVVE